MLLKPTVNFIFTKPFLDKITLHVKKQEGDFDFRFRI